MSDPVIHALPDPVGLAHPFPLSDLYDPAVFGPEPMGPGQHTFNYALEMDPSGTWLAQSNPAKPEPPNEFGNYREIGELHLYHRIGEQWHHTFVETGVAYGGPARALRFSPDGNWLIVNRHGQPDTVRPDGSYDYPYMQRSRRLQVYRRDGERLVFHSFGPDVAYVDTSLAPSYGYGLDFDATGRWLALCGYLGFNGLLSFDPDAGTLTVASGTNTELFMGGGFNPDGSVNPDYDYSAYTANVAANAYVWQAWNPADASMLLRINQAFQPLLFRRDGDTLVYAGAFTDVNAGNFAQAAALFPSWHPSGKVISLMHQEACGSLIPVMHAYPGGAVLGAVRSYAAGDTADPSVYFGLSKTTFDRTGQYLSTTATNTYVQSFTLRGVRVSAFDPGGHPLPLSPEQPPDATADYSGSQLLAEPLPHSSGPGVVWGYDRTGGGRYLAIAAEDVLLGSGLDFSQIPDEWASPWGFRLYRIDGEGAPISEPAVVSILSMALPDGTVTKVGTTEQPLGVVLPDAGVRVWPDTGNPLYQMQPDGTWRTVIGVDAT